MIIIFLANIFFPLYEDIIGFSRIMINCLILQSFGSYLIYFYGAKLNVEFRYKPYLLISFINTLGNILLSVFLIVFVFNTERYIGRILGTAIPVILLAIVISIIVMKKGKKIINIEYWKYALVIGLPLVPHVVSQSLLSQFDRIMIGSMVGASEAGIYSYIYTLCTIMSVICTSLDNAWTPWVFIKLKNNESEKVKQSSVNYIKIYTILTIGFICVMPEITKLLAGKEYWEGIDLLIPLTISNYFIFLYMLPINIEYYNKKTKYISIGTVSATIVNVILNSIFIHFFGYKIAAYTTLISYMLLFVFHWKIAEKYNIKQSYNFKIILKYIVYVFLVGITIYIANKIYFLGILYRYFIILVIFIYFYKNKEIFLNMIKSNNRG